MKPPARAPDASPGATGEFALIARHFDRRLPGRAPLGIGDDCALLAPPAAGHLLAVSTDMLVAGRHFFEDVDPAALGHKALAVNLSDLAAMGARPVAFTLALSLPWADDAWLASFACGLFALADHFGCELVGGDTTRGPLNVCITVFGEVDPALALRRDRACPGDDVWVSGELGAAAFAVRERLQGRPCAPGSPARTRLERPQPRVALGLALRGLASAAIDLSDGLLGDLAHLCERSAVAIRVQWPSVPCADCLAQLPGAERAALAMTGGDDYELAFTAPVGRRDEIEAVAGVVGVRLARIGQVEPGAGVRVDDGRGGTMSIAATGFDHFV